MTYSLQNKMGGELNRLLPEDVPVHGWYRFILSFPPHLVRNYLERFGVQPGQCVLDPFCGTGTTLVECKKSGIASIGIEANPVVQFAATVKAHWGIDPDTLLKHAAGVAERAHEILSAEGIPDELFFEHGNFPANSFLRTLLPEQERLLITNSISPRPLHKVLTLLDVLEQSKEHSVYAHERLALAKQLVHSISNLKFGPEVGVGKIKPDAPVIATWLAGIKNIASDLHLVQSDKDISSRIYLSDARQIQTAIEPSSIDAVITSPPYPNEKDYTRTTRLESVVLGFMKDRGDLRTSKQNLLRSNTRGVYKNDEDVKWIADNRRVCDLADTIELQRIQLKKTSGFEKLYAQVVRLYFGGMARHLQQIQPLLKPGAYLAYVVGDQASYFQILIRTGEIIAEIAERLGYEVIGIDLFRSRFSTATQQLLREEVVVLRWK